MRVQTIEVPYDSGWRDRRMGRGVAPLVDQAVSPAARAAGWSMRRHRVDVKAPFTVEAATAFALHRETATAVAATLDEGAFPLVVSGNCNVAAIGAVTGLRRSRGADDVALLWLDAHADCETPETTESAFLDGMGLAMLAGECWRGPMAALPGFAPLAGPRVALIGARQVSGAEVALMRRLGIHALPVAALTEASAAAALTPILTDWRRDGVRAVYLHVDVDVFDPAKVAPANCFAEPNGLMPAHVRDLVAVVGRALSIGAMALTAYDPDCDPDRGVPPAAAEIVAAVLETAGVSAVRR